MQKAISEPFCRNKFLRNHFWQQFCVNKLIRKAFSVAFCVNKFLRKHFQQLFCVNKLIRKAFSVAFWINKFLRNHFQQLFCVNKLIRKAFSVAFGVNKFLRKYKYNPILRKYICLEMHFHAQKPNILNHRAAIRQKNHVIYKFIHDMKLIQNLFSLKSEQNLTNTSNTEKNTVVIIVVSTKYLQYYFLYHAYIDHFKLYYS